MFDFLENLRKKPEKTRRKVALAITVSIMVVIFVFWIIALIWKIENPPQNSATNSPSLSSDISDFIQKAKAAAPNISF